MSHGRNHVQRSNTLDSLHASCACSPRSLLPALLLACSHSSTAPKPSRVDRTAEAGPMNLEGAVALGFAKELAKVIELSFHLS